MAGPLAPAGPRVQIPNQPTLTYLFTYISEMNLCGHGRALAFLPGAWTDC